MAPDGAPAPGGTAMTEIHEVICKGTVVIGHDTLDVVCKGTIVIIGGVL
jgi:hypothetical protein